MRALLFILFLFIPGLALAESPDDAISKVITLHLKQLNECYSESGLTIKGTVVMIWDVNDAGDVLNAKVAIKSTIRDLNVASCFTSRLQDLKFPAAPHGEVVHATYTFDFTK